MDPDVIFFSVGGGGVADKQTKDRGQEERFPPGRRFAVAYFAHRAAASRRKRAQPFPTSPAACGQVRSRQHTPCGLDLLGRRLILLLPRRHIACVPRMFSTTSAVVCAKANHTRKFHKIPLDFPDAKFYNTEKARGENVCQTVSPSSGRQAACKRAHFLDDSCRLPKLSGSEGK